MSLKRAFSKLRRESNNNNNNNDNNNSANHSDPDSATNTPTATPSADSLRPSTQPAPTSSQQQLQHGGTSTSHHSHTHSLSLSHALPIHGSHRDLLRGRRSHDSPTRSPVRIVKEKLHIGDEDSESSGSGSRGNSDDLSRKQQRKAERLVRREHKRQEAAARVEELERRRRSMEVEARANETPEMRTRYGVMPVNSYADPKFSPFVDNKDIPAVLAASHGAAAAASGTTGKPPVAESAISSPSGSTTTATDNTVASSNNKSATTVVYTSETTTTSVPVDASSANVPGKITTNNTTDTTSSSTSTATSKPTTSKDVAAPTSSNPLVPSESTTTVLTSSTTISNFTDTTTTTSSSSLTELAQSDANIPVSALHASDPSTLCCPRMTIREFNASMIGKDVAFRARIHNVRQVSSHLVFFEFRQQTATIQGVLLEDNLVSRYMMYWAQHLSPETVVVVRGVLQAPAAKQGEVLGTSIHDVELAIKQMHVEGSVVDHLPFTVHEADLERSELQGDDDQRVLVNDRSRLANRVLDLRTGVSLSIFRIQAGICRFFRTHLDSEGFVEIHTPKLQGTATESGASVFRVDYFGRPAFLAQSPQLAKQMAIASDFRRVYEIGPVFRAENSNTHRHMTEFTGLDLEMAIDRHYHEVLDMLDNTFKAIYSGIYREYRHEIEQVKRHYPHEDLLWLEHTPRIPFAQGIRMLNESGWRDEEGKELPEDEDLGTRDEIALGRLIREKFHTDFYILDKFPASARPFYAMPDPENPHLTNSFDIFLRGQEILSGGQRIHDAEMLRQRMTALKMDPADMSDYISGFAWGAPPHGGGGIGLERMLFLLLDLGDIRHGSMFPRDPRSFPEKPIMRQLRHPEASTMPPPWDGQDHTLNGGEMQPIEKLIANYGDATNTSWLEPRTRLWRDVTTGAAVGYVPIDGFAITIGNPLCHSSQYERTIERFLRFLRKETALKPLWVLVSGEVEETLATRFNWRTFSVTAEQRLDPSDVRMLKDHEVSRKIRHAEKEGIRIVDYALGKPVPQDIRNKVDEKVMLWLRNRKGKQVHLTEIRPWQDMEHRSYHLAYAKDGSLIAFVALAQLSPEHGYQVKYSLDFPGAPSGSIEALIGHVLKGVAAEGVPSVTFGGGASSRFTPGHNMRGTKVKVLSKTYHAIVTELKLTNKTEFREKLGAKEEASWLCYPPHGMGPSGIKAIMKFFEDED